MDTGCQNKIAGMELDAAPNFPPSPFVLQIEGCWVGGSSQGHPLFEFWLAYAEKEKSSRFLICNKFLNQI